MSVKSNAQILKEILKELHDVKTELIETKNIVKDLNSRMPERKNGWFGGYWELKDNLKDGLSINYENINKDNI